MEDTMELPITFIPSYARGLSVLLVEPDISSLECISSMLEQFSYKVTTAERGSVALSMIRQEKDRFKLVMASVNMPDMDCISFVREVLLEVEEDIPVILMAPERCLSAAIKALHEGASLYLDKPISMDDLKYVWQHAFTKKRRQELASEDTQASYGDNLLGGHHSTNNEGNGKGKAPMRVSDRPPTEAMMVDNKGKGKQAKRRDSGSTVALIDGSATGKEGENEASVNSGEDKRKKGKEDGESSRASMGVTVSKKRNSRIVWTPELHFKFLAAIRSLGHRKLCPKAILELMNMHTLTERQVSCHLQKCKSNLKRIWKNRPSNFYDTSSRISPVLEESNKVVHELHRQASFLTTSGTGIPFNFHDMNRSFNPLMGTTQRQNYGPGEFTSGKNLSYLFNFPANVTEQMPSVMIASNPPFSNNAPYSDKFLAGFGERNQNPAAGNFLDANKSVTDFDNLGTDKIKKGAPTSGSEFTRTQPWSEYIDLLNALEDEEKVPSELVEPSAGDVNRYCEWLADSNDQLNVLKEDKPVLSELVEPSAGDVSVNSDSSANA